MRKRKSKFYIFVFIIIFTISFGYALLNRNIVINGKSNISKLTWDIHFENVVLTSGSATDVAPDINGDSLTYNTSLNLPGDFYEFTVDIVNEGTIDAVIEDINFTGNFREEYMYFLNLSILYEDGNQVDTLQYLLAGERKKIVVRLEYRKDVIEEFLPQEDLSISGTYSIVYGQADPSVSYINAFGKQWFQPPGISLYDTIDNIFASVEEIDYTLPRPSDYGIYNTDSFQVLIDDNGKVVNLRNTMVERYKSYIFRYFGQSINVDDDRIASGDYVTLYVDMSNVYYNIQEEIKVFPCFMDSSDTYVNVVHSIFPTGFMSSTPEYLADVSQELLNDYILAFPSGNSGGCENSSIHSFFAFIDENGNLTKMTDKVNSNDKRTTVYLTINEEEMSYDEAKAYVLGLVDEYF